MLNLAGCVCESMYRLDFSPQEQRNASLVMKPISIVALARVGRTSLGILRLQHRHYRFKPTLLYKAETFFKVMLNYYQSLRRRNIIDLPYLPNNILF
jgi:hypothetical protein